MIMNMVGVGNNDEPNILLLTKNISYVNSSSSTTNVLTLQVLFDSYSDSSNYKYPVNTNVISNQYSDLVYTKMGGSTSTVNSFNIGNNNLMKHPNKPVASFLDSSLITNNQYVVHKYDRNFYVSTSGSTKSAMYDIEHISGLYNVTNLGFISIEPVHVKLELDIRPTYWMGGGFNLSPGTTILPKSYLEFDVDGDVISNISYDFSNLFNLIDSSKRAENSKMMVSSTPAANYEAELSANYYIDEVKPI